MAAEYSAEQAAADEVKILAALAAVTPEARQRLQAAVDAVDALGDGEYGEWSDPARGFPYLKEAGEVKELRDAISRAGLTVPFGWPQWLATLDHPSDLPFDDPVTAVRTITAIVRGNRFNEGLLVRHLESGQLIGALRMALTG